MRKLGYLGVLVILAVPLQAQSVEHRIRLVGERLQTLLNKFNEADLQWFSPDFYKEVPKEKLINGLKFNSQLLGTVQRVRITKLSDPWSGEIELIGEADKRLRIALRLETGPLLRISYLLFGVIDKGDDTWERLQTDLAKLPGKNAVSVWKLTPTITKVFSRQSTEPLAVGSSLKLLVFSALCDEISAGNRKWSDMVMLQDEGRSLPSGLLQDWPTGSPVTLHTLATLMLSRSDNTAADHLMMTLGRTALEEHQKTAQVQYPERNRPFLRTNELFKLKLVMTPQQKQSFLQLSEQGKREYLSELAKIKLTSPRLPESPVSIDQLEWFFTTDDMARLLDRLRQTQQNSEALSLLAITKPFDIDDYSWKYLGFKGGAEVGVLNLSLLGQLRSTSEWYAFSLTWNDAEHALNEPLWIQIAQRAVRLVERGK